MIAQQVSEQKTMKSWITTPTVTNLLDALYADATSKDSQALRAARALGKESEGRYEGMRSGYMAVGPEFGRLLYGLARGSRAKTVVEFGTSFGVSTIFLASAIRDNGGGKVIATEFHPEKAERARQNLAAADLEEWVEIRVGDALETLSNPPSEIDMIFLDGAKDLYLDVFKLLEPQLRSAGVVASDNTDKDAVKPFLDYIRNPENGYTSTAIFTEGLRGKCHEITFRS